MAVKLHKHHLTHPQETGRMMKLWKKQHEEEKRMQQYIMEQETTLLPTVYKSPQVIPQFIQYRCPWTVSPFMLLYGACLASIEQLGKPPAAIFISSTLLPLFKKQSEQVLQARYTGRFYFACNGYTTPNGIAVLTEKDLPTLLGLAFHYHIDRDMVIVTA